MLQQNVAEIERMTKMSGDNSFIKFIVAQATAAIAPSSYLDRWMMYSYLILFTFSSYVTWMFFTLLVNSLLGGYANFVYCILALSVPTFAITIPVYRFKNRVRPAGGRSKKN